MCYLAGYDLVEDGREDEEEEQKVILAKGGNIATNTSTSSRLSLCPACPDRSPVADLARHNARYHRDKTVKGMPAHYY